MTRGMIEDLERRGVLGVGMARPPPESEIEAKPNHDEVVVFRDFFIAGLRFPLDPVVVEIFKLFDVYTHQMTPTSFVLAEPVHVAIEDLQTKAFRHRLHPPLQVPLSAKDGVCEAQ